MIKMVSKEFNIMLNKIERTVGPILQQDIIYLITTLSKQVENLENQILKLKLESIK